MITFFKDILSDPALLLGVFIFFGLILQKDKGASDVIKGTFKGILGFIVLGSGAGVLVKALGNFGSLFQTGFNVTGVVPNNEAIVSLALGEFGQATALIMVGGMVANIIIARFTKWKYIFLTGHHTLFMACLIAVVLEVAGIKGGMLILAGSLILGFTMTWFPALAQPTMRKLTGNDDIALGHFGTIGYLSAIAVGKVVGKGSKSTEEIKFPKNLGFLRDSSVSIALTMSILFLIVTLKAGPDAVTKLGIGSNYIVWSIKEAITFSAGIFIILAGVRLIITEITPAFKGIADKVVPGAKPALDCPVVFPFAENAVIIGFLSSFVGGIVGMVILIAMKTTVILPGVIPHFFLGATSGVLANAVGGRKGAVIGSFVQGLVITFLPVLLLPVLGNLGFANTTFGDSDFGVMGILLGTLAKNGATAVLLVSFALFLIPFFITIIEKRKRV